MNRLDLDTGCLKDKVKNPRRLAAYGAIVKWDHATMAWLNLGFKSPWLQCDFKPKRVKANNCANNELTLQAEWDSV